MGFYVIALGSNESHLRHGFAYVSKGLNFEKVRFTLNAIDYLHRFRNFGCGLLST